MSLSRVLCVCVIGLSIGFSPMSRADVILPDLPPEPNALHLRTGKVVLEPAQSLHRLDPAAPGATIAEKGHYVIQLDGPLTPVREAALAQAGVTLGQYLPMYAYIVELPAGFNAPAQLTGLDFVRWLGAYDAGWKLDPEIASRTYQTQDRQQMAAEGVRLLTVKLLDGSDTGAAIDQIANLPGATITNLDPREDGDLIEVRLPDASIQLLAQVKQIQFVEEAPELTLRNNSNAWILQSYSSGNTSVWNKGVTGVGQLGGHIDDPVSVSHCSFRDASGNPVGPSHRKIQFYGGTQSYGQHGLHTAATFVGDEFPINGTTTLRGMAYGARLVHYRYSSMTGIGLLATFNTMFTNGARVYTNSWGDDGTTAYTQWCVDIDTFSFNNEDALVCFAETNTSTLKTPENAKNCLAVSASTDNPATSLCFGGAGPTNDQRRKPELMAPGCSTTSASGSGTVCTSANLSGTSMASPAVAGAGLLVRQYYTDGYYPTGAAVPANGFTPSGALIRATLINSGADVTGIAGFPSNTEGWGRVLLEDALYFAGDARKLIVLDDPRRVNGLTTGQSKTYGINVTAGMPLKITLVWTERQAALNANPAYINDLNLVVTGPGGTYLGNFFSGGQSTTGGSADFRNNAEQVYLISPPAGTYTVTVNAIAVNAPGSPQGFALVATGNVVLTPQQPDCDQSGGFDLTLDTACFVDVLLGINTNPASQAAVDMDGNTFNNGQDIQQWIDCVVNNVCN